MLGDKKPSFGEMFFETLFDIYSVLVELIYLQMWSHWKSGINTDNSNPWLRGLKTASVPILPHQSGYYTFTLQQTDVCLSVCLSPA